ncbi:hypothetical protein CPB86DRAFT_719976 [Serendipita vermifera]|nr:hypothetical protein CPB86DRAFT_719976 [Serendipita vermifera]
MWGVHKEPVEVVASNETSYEDGSPRNHHSLYIDSGDIVIQVEMAIFKVHSFFLIKHSEVLRNMITISRGERKSNDGTVDKPLVLQDKARGWEILLHSFYRDEPFIAFEFTGQDMVYVLEIAHKYCMTRLEEGIIRRLERAQTTQEYVDMMLASKVIGSDEFWAKGLKGLVDVTPKPNLEQAKAIGVEAYFHVINNSTCKKCRFGK